MSKIMTAQELTKHCERAVTDLKNLLLSFAQSTVEKMPKRAMLIAYWVKTYVKYIQREDSFSPESVYKLKRGSVVCVEFGYRIGRELGGRHYAVVLDANNSIHRNTVTVVPLGSLKAHSRDDEYNVLLEDGVYVPVHQKIDALIKDARAALQDALSMNATIDSAVAEDRVVLRTIQRQKRDSAEKLIEQANSWMEEISQLSSGSVAKVDQITTVSKMRISQPLKKTHPLYGVRLSAEDLDKIDAQLMKLYFSKK